MHTNIQNIVFKFVLDGYGPWSDCSVSCGGGWKSRTVSSEGPGGSMINTTESTSCNTQLCEGQYRFENNL